MSHLSLFISGSLNLLLDKPLIETYIPFDPFYFSAQTKEMSKIYLDRREAGAVLAESLKAFKNQKDTIILGLPRGGVPVAYEVAQTLRTPLDVFIVRKLGVPGQPELAMGAIASGNTVIFNEDIIHHLGISKTAIDRIIQAEKIELARREQSYRGKKPFPDLTRKTVILIDDGIATGATMRAAVKALRQMHPTKIVIAVPVAEKSTCKKMSEIADEVICPQQPDDFYAVGAWYENFSQTTDEEVRELLNQ